MDIFVINLASSKDRLESITAELAAAHLNFTRISAIDGSSLSPSELNTHYQSNLNKRTYRRPLSLGEIGCYLSHRNCWQQVVDNKLAMALILEDDAALSDQLPAVLSTIEQLPIKWDIIKLCDPQKLTKHSSTVLLDNKTRLCQYKKIPSRATGYVVSQNGALKLLKARNVFGRPVDDDIQFYWEFNGEVFGIEPSPIRNSKLAAISDIDIDSSRQSTKTMLSRVKAPLLRLDYEIRLLIHNRKRKALSVNALKPSAW
jgi:glycosyl transferase family 25